MFYNDGGRGTGTAAEMALDERARLAADGVVVAAVDVLRSFGSGGGGGGDGPAAAAAAASAASDGEASPSPSSSGDGSGGGGSPAKGGALPARACARACA